MNVGLALALKIAAASCFGGAVALLTIAAYRVTQRTRAAGTLRGATSTSMRRADMRQQALRNSEMLRLSMPFISAMGGTVNRLGLDSLREYLHEPYIRAGYPGGLDDDELLAVAVYLGILLTILIGFMAAALFSISWVWLALLGLPLGFMGLAAHLKSRAKERELEIMRAMPYMLDLMVLMLRSGTSMRIALGRVVSDYENHPIGVEFGQVLAEIDVGSPRSEAFKKMALRLKIPDITSLVDAVVQSEELGWPLAETLERLADRINAERILAAQATAGAAGVYVMLPSTLVLLSAVIILFAPFIVQYLRTGNLID